MDAILKGMICLWILKWKMSEIILGVIPFLSFAGPFRECFDAIIISAVDSLFRHQIYV